MADENEAVDWQGLMGHTAAEFSEMTEQRFETAVVETILKQFGRLDVFREMRRDRQMRTGEYGVAFADFFEKYPQFPLFLFVRRFPKLEENLTVAVLVERFEKSKIWQEYSRVFDETPYGWNGTVGLVFFWPRLKVEKTSQGGALVLHNRPSVDVEIPGFFAGLVDSSGQRYWLESLPRLLDSLKANNNFAVE